MVSVTVERRCARQAFVSLEHAFNICGINVWLM